MHHFTLSTQSKFSLLLGTEDPVASIAQAGDDVAVVVQVQVHGSHIHIYIGMLLADTLCAFGSGDKMQAHKEKYTALRRERRLAEQEAAVLEVMVEEANTNE